MSYGRIKDLIPFGFVCPICKTPRPSIHQWARTNDGDVVCRTCMNANPCLRIDPLLHAHVNAERVAQERRQRHITNERAAIALQQQREDNQLIRRAHQLCVGGLCCICQQNKTLRVQGYCRECRYDLLITIHCGVGEIRIDLRGRIFQVLPDSGTLLRAAYCWGDAHLPLTRSWPSTSDLYRMQRNYMFDWTVKLMATPQIRTLQRKHGQAFDDCAVESIGRAVLTYDSSKDKKDSKDMLSYVLRVLTRAIRKQTLHSKRREHRQIRETLAAKPQPTFLDIERDPIQELESLGLTEFERHIMYLWAVEKKTQEAIGEQYGWTKSNTHAIIKKIRDKCK